MAGIVPSGTVLALAAAAQERLSPSVEEGRKERAPASSFLPVLKGLV